MEEWVLLFDLLYSYLKQCHETWKVLQKLKGRPNYSESTHQLVDVVAPALHRYAVHFRRLSLKQQKGMVRVSCLGDGYQKLVQN